MNDDDGLIQRLKQFDAQQRQAIEPTAARALAQRVVQASSRQQAWRRVRQRTVATLFATACVGLVAGWIVWQRPPRGQQTIAVTESSPPITPTPTVELNPTAPVQVATQDASAEQHSREQAEELKRLVAEHAQLQQRLHELETQILRAELSQRVMDELQIPSDVFY